MPSALSYSDLFTSVQTVWEDLKADAKALMVVSLQWNATGPGTELNGARLIGSRSPVAKSSSRERFGIAKDGLVSSHRKPIGKCLRFPF
jgi:hypothetical protein